MLTVVGMFIISCGVEEYYENLLPQSEVDFSRKYIHRLLLKDFEYAKSVSDSFVSPLVAGNQVLRVIDTLMVGDHISTLHLKSLPLAYGEEIHRQYLFEIHYPYQWWIISIVVFGESDHLTVSGFNITKAASSQLELTRFFLNKRPFYFYVLLMYQILATIFVFVTLILAFKTKMGQRKWLWILLIFIAYGQYTLNWTTGEYTLNLLILKTIPGGIGTTGIYDPWYVDTMLPIGAILFWVKWYKLRNPRPPATEEDTESNA